jgi:predicted phosphate transport protein (TIGR00153 family)
MAAGAMMRKFGKQQKVQEQISLYNGHVVSCLDVFKRTFADICSTTGIEKLREGYSDVQAAEKAADTTRRALENMMYTEAVFPESRGDILGLIESLDKVANHAESAVRMVLNQHIEIPGEYYASIADLVTTSHKCVITLVRAVEQLFDSFVDAAVTVGEVHRLESEADAIEEKLVDRIFTSDQSDLQKILLRDLVQHLSTIADRAESAGDRVRIMVAKRSV